MKNKRCRKVIGVATLLTTAAFLVACGGGGGGGSATNQPPTNQPPTNQPPGTQPPSTNPPPVNRAPVANAGTNRAVAEGTVVHLDGGASSDADGDSLTYQWTQRGGPTVSLSSPGSVNPSFLAPADISANEDIAFELVANDGRLDSSPSTVILTIVAAPPPVDDGFPTTVVAALSGGQFTLNNLWTQADLDYENITADISYGGNAGSSAVGKIRSYTTLVHQYFARREQCQEDYGSFYAPSSFTVPFTGGVTVYTFRDRKCYPSLQLANELAGGPSNPVMQRYGYYCGGGFPTHIAYERLPEPLDGVDYCCWLHDETAWTDPSETASNECGIAMCLSKASAMPNGVLALLPDVVEARDHWYDGAATLCWGNQTDNPGWASGL